MSKSMKLRLGLQNGTISLSLYFIKRQVHIPGAIVLYDTNYMLMKPFNFVYPQHER